TRAEARRCGADGLAGRRARHRAAVEAREPVDGEEDQGYEAGGRTAGQSGVVSLADISRFLRDSVTEWRSLRLAELLFGHRDAARTVAVVLLLISVTALVIRSLVGRRPGRNRVAMPAILPFIGQAPLSVVRH